MLEPMTSFVSIIYGLSGAIGIAFFLLIIAINIYNFGWYYPKKLSASNLVEQSTISPRKLQALSIISMILFAWFTLEVFFLSEAALWLKVLAGIVFFAIVSYVVWAIWRLTQNDPAIETRKTDFS